MSKKKKEKCCANCVYGQPVDYGWKGRFHCWLCNLTIKNPITKKGKVIGNNLGWKDSGAWENYGHAVYIGGDKS